MHSMFGGNAYKVAMIQQFSFTFLLFFYSAKQLIPLRLCLQTSTTKLRYLQSSTFYRQHFRIDLFHFTIV